MDADIIAPDGTLLEVIVKRVGRLMSGGSITLSISNSEECFLETDSEVVNYSEGMRGPNIMYVDRIENALKHAMKTKNYYFYIQLSGQGNRISL